MRGAERTFAAIAECWPDADVYTLLYDEEGTDGRFAHRNVETSYLQRLSVHQDGFRRLLPLFPHAVRRLDTIQHDLLISSSSAFAHGVRSGPAATHICYCYTPFRYAWYEQERALQEVPRPLRPALSTTLRQIRKLDVAAAREVDHYIAISELSRDRIARYLSREATIVHPPVEVDRFEPGEPEDFLLVVTELVPHKCVEAALQAARRAGMPIKVVGTGPDLARLRALYGDAAEFLGRLDDDALAALYPRALALVMPNVEEFGITAVEAQAAGRPVVACGAGGALETVIDGETGVLFPRNDVDALTEILRESDFTRFDPGRQCEHANQFSVEAFKRRFGAEVERACGVTPPSVASMAAA
jgi:glycosyltransferase involved in cell wall biosynthesis